MDEELAHIKKKKLEEMKKEWGVKKVVVKVNDANFEKEVLEKSKETPVAVDFWAAWCMPCQMLGPVLENIAKNNKGKFVLAKVNVDESPKTSSAYKISGIPAVKLFKNGEVAAEFVGAMPEETVIQWLEQHL